MPDRIGRVLLLGGGPLAPEQAPPTFFKILVSPIGALLVRLPQKAARIRSIMEGLGHGPSLAVATRLGPRAKWVAFALYIRGSWLPRDSCGQSERAAITSGYGNFQRSSTQKLVRTTRTKGWSPGIHPAHDE
jgi:hypothetical protein